MSAGVFSVFVLHEYSDALRQPHGTAHIRLLRPLTHPALAETVRMRHGTEIEPCDVLIVDRLWKPDFDTDAAEALVNRAREQDSRILYALDDNLFEIEPNPARGAYPSEAQLFGGRWLAREADAILTTTPRLAERLRHFNPEVYVVPNALDEQLWEPDVHPPAARMDDGRLLLGYMGTLTHEADLRMILEPLRTFLRARSNTVRMQLVGIAPHSRLAGLFEGLPVDILWPEKHAAYPDFVRWMRSRLRWDIGLAPLEDTRFNQSKSDIKYLDYALLGIPGIYSRVPAYTDSVVHGSTGWLVDNTPEAWLAALETLADRTDVRAALQAGAFRAVHDTRVLSAAAGEWLRVLRAVASQPPRRPRRHPAQAASPDRTLEIERASNTGERVVHLYRNDCFYAHLSIYRFAHAWIRDRHVLDAGCGTGYGSADLATHGASTVLGVDQSAEAIDLAQRSFQLRGLTFQRMDLAQLVQLGSRQFDVIFSSNVLEHFAGIQQFLHGAVQRLTPEGLFILAVPPILDQASRENELLNPHHLNIWTPEQWMHTLGQYFRTIQLYRHAFDRDDVTLDLSNVPEVCRITEADFSFIPCSIEEMREHGTLTAVMLARTPRPESERPAPGAPIEFIDDSFTRSA